MYKIKKKDYYVSKMLQCYKNNNILQRFKTNWKISVEGGIRDQEIGLMSDLRLKTLNFN